MSFVWGDGADHYDTAHLTAKWTTASTNPPTVSNTGRNAGNCIRTITQASGSNLQTCTKTLPAVAGWVVGFALRANPLPSNAQHVCTLLDAGSVQVGVRLNADGTLTVHRNGTALTDGTSVLAVTANAWYYVEFKVTISNSISSNTCKVRVNGVDWLTVASGQDTQATSTASANGVRFGQHDSSSNSTIDFDDIYVLNTSGSVNNDFIGDTRAEWIYPTAAGTTTEWTPSAGSNYQCVDENPPTDDTDYVSTAVVDEIDLYTLSNLTTTPTTIHAVQTCLLARKDDGGDRLIAPVVRSGGGNYVGTSVGLGLNYVYDQQVRETDPATTVAWTESGVNSLEMGQKLVS